MATTFSSNAPPGSSSLFLPLSPCLHEVTSERPLRGEGEGALEVVRTVHRYLSEAVGSGVLRSCPEVTTETRWNCISLLAGAVARFFSSQVQYSPSHPGSRQGKRVEGTVLKVPTSHWPELSHMVVPAPKEPGEHCLPPRAIASYSAGERGEWVVIAALPGRYCPCLPGAGAEPQLFSARWSNGSYS